MAYVEAEQYAFKFFIPFIKRAIKKRNKEIIPKMKKGRLLEITLQAVVGKTRSECFDSSKIILHFGAPIIFLLTVISAQKQQISESYYQKL